MEQIDTVFQMHCKESMCTMKGHFFGHPDGNKSCTGGLERLHISVFDRFKAYVEVHTKQHRDEIILVMGRRCLRRLDRELRKVRQSILS